MSNHEVPRGESVSNEVVNKLINDAVDETIEISNVRYKSLYLFSQSINTINIAIFHSTYLHLMIHISNPLIYCLTRDL